MLKNYTVLYLVHCIPDLHVTSCWYLFTNLGYASWKWVT